MANIDYSRARIISDPAPATIVRWLVAGWRDFCLNRTYSLLYGGGLVLFGWALILLLFRNGLAWALLPMLAGGVLVGPVVTVGLYRVASGKTRVAAKGQITLVGIILMVFAMAWIRAATILFAIVYGLKPFEGFVATLSLLLSTSSGWVLLVSGTLVGGLFAALGFAVSAFSLPMLVERDIDGFSAMGLSFNATTQNFRLTVLWGMTIAALTALGILTGFLGLVIIFPLLGYATWHAYDDLFRQGGGAKPQPGSEHVRIVGEEV
ncbi:membrane protein, putative (plasmid) [Ruegeria pomeroyi DSS-3]|uniref:Membrane protein, putative n=2 Tax=Ruegeria pomeroyi TaxID=89184 RepID=Q5LL38_RUEPO|nr:membrane protein, putative [Ruegeria pomeroyi DSS-3]NVK96796.1 DUF2189 domain-containing protein [Ruegeria pomeroyi]NVL00014.1 DUF2189 domain-containing protein [Ruegeria pomeroyi]HCE71354.1 DUF2189 domain-containing protein [Ruegeria sp.]